VSPRTLVFLLTYVAFPMGVAVGVALGVTFHWAFAFLMFPWGLLIKRVSDRVRCPRCGEHPYRREWKAKWEGPMPARICGHCSWDLARGAGEIGPDRE
jgi:hypothetical protein